MARSFATAMLRPRGSNEACATQDAIIAPLALLLAAVTTYKPEDSRARAFATSGDMLRFFCMDSFCVRACAISVPASSNSCRTKYGLRSGLLQYTKRSQSDILCCSADCTNPVLTGIFQKPHFVAKNQAYLAQFKI